MQLTPGIGIDHLIFGMRRSDVVMLLGEPDKIADDPDDDNQHIHQYNTLKLRLTYYKDEDYKLGYIRCANPELCFNGNIIIGIPVADVIAKVFSPYPCWEPDSYTFFDTYFSEQDWIVLTVDYDVVTAVEIGVPFINDETYNWPKIP